MMVSYIVNCRNENSQWFIRAILSILHQVDVEKQIILSTVSKDPCIKWMRDFHGENFTLIIVAPPEKYKKKSPASSFWQLNNAVQFIKGDYVTFCSANDPLISTKSINEINRMKETGAKVCYSAFHIAEICDKDKGYLCMNTKGFPEEYTLERHMQSNFIYDGSMVDAQLFKKYMPFELKWYNCGYWDLWLRIFKGEGNVFCYNDVPTKYYIQHEDSMHIKRQRTPADLKRRNDDTAAMLAHHREIFGV